LAAAFIMSWIVLDCGRAALANEPTQPQLELAADRVPTEHDDRDRDRHEQQGRDGEQGIVGKAGGKHVAELE